ncbi:MAG: hypothetical protein HFI67_03125 [Lachnospiraceae bacterium]|jgi:hypothetical protein|nr:hypothetical protein [Lachnospiraceae bacterium]
MYHVSVCLTPDWDGEKITDLAVRIRADIPARKGEPLFLINLVTIFKPFTELSEPMALEGDGKKLPLLMREEEKPPIKQGVYVPETSSDGWTLCYQLKLAPGGRNPVFDLGYEKGGMNGAGMTFMPAFYTEDEVEYTLSWELSALPGEALGVWSFGQGTVRRTGNDRTLMETFYAAGLLDCVRLGNFSYYWFENDRILDNAVATSQIFRYESRFFRDKGEPYTIFVRHTDGDEIRAGGTALARSYMYLYRENEQLDPVWLKFLFAHEMVHNWIHLKDEPFGTCTWYVEGMAEYYSAVLPLRMGVVTGEELADQLNRRAADYYENPKRHASNGECGAGLMADRELTRVPYGRGFFYLTHADSRIRQATGGMCCLDDVTLVLNEKFREDDSIQNEAWIEEYGKYVGEETALAEYEYFRDGGLVIPAVDCFGGAVTVKKEQGAVRETGETCDIWKFYAEE